MNLRDYQQRAVESVEAGWATFKRQLIVLPTGAGKTIVFSHIAQREKGRTLILAHRKELIAQAAAKLHAATGIFASIEQGSSRAMPGHGVIVASVQSMAARLAKYPPDAFDLIICDEAHHVPGFEWQKVLGHFRSARILGVTATPNRADNRKLGEFFDNLAFEIGLLELIGAGHLCGLRSLCLPVELDARHLLKKRGEISADDAAGLVSPRLRELAAAVASEIWDRKALVFLPRCDVSEQFAEALRCEGINAQHVDGGSEDRDTRLAWFAGSGKGAALCNAVLLSEGYDQPDVDCVVCLRATKSQSLYAQIVGRGTRLSPGKDYCLLIDPLWLSGDMDLCRPADLIAPNKDHRAALQKHLDEGLDLLAAEERAKVDVEGLLAERLKEAQKRKKAPAGLVDPLAYAIGIHGSDLGEWEATMPWHEELPTAEQMKALKAFDIWTENVTRGYAVKLLERLESRKAMGLASPKMVRFLMRQNHPDAQVVTAERAAKLFAEIRRNWR